MSNSILAIFSRKMNIVCDDVLRKADEFQRIVEVRCGSSLSSLNLTSTAIVVICLEIAANSSGLSTSRDTSIQLSGLTKKFYCNAYKTVESILGQEKRISLQDLAVMFGCLSAAPYAKKVFEKFKSTQNSGIDLDQPLFVAATFYIVCRSKKVRIDKTKLMNKINVKRSLFDKVCKQIKPVMEKMSETGKKFKRPYSWLEESCEKSTNSESSNKRIRVLETEKKQKEMEDYINWKRKLLE
ncbi:origin recognition complex subunit 6-like [Xenia sp. Carnegie-2017]|uniref:origin recognition complex subunit 6-like n=1 Tax=Xenia sp. Carnegie-2017 TaxID=2897299 RepID=UPI001F04AB85|nr:origin recognition complex subunit 6-like [Xenia sp. Carnegie-2017]